MATEVIASAFDQALSDFRESLKRDGLKKRDEEMFSRTTRDGFLTNLRELQNEQQAKRRGRNLARLEPLVEAMDQLGKVVEVFVNAQVLVAFIWGPMKLILQIADAFADAFNDLLTMYASIGDSFSLLTQSEQLFRTDSQMIRLLILMYKDIFEFHRQAIKYFKQPFLKQLFQATWKTYKSRFSPLIDRIHSHADLIHRQATLSEIRRSQQARDDSDAERELRMEENQKRRLRALYDWLHSPNVENDQHYFSDIRKQCPGTGKWLLGEPTFQEWFDPKFYSPPALLWINGIPGAGKTILASFVIEAARTLPSPPTVLFFYCKNGDKEKDNFESIGRTFLMQLLNGNKDILMPYYNASFSNSTEATLRTICVIEELLRISILNCPNVYIILDGIDECERDERKRITEWFRKLVEDSSDSGSGHIRCVFISQDDGLARKDFRNMTTLKIESKHNSADIMTYCEGSANEIRTKFELDDEKSREIARKVHKTAKGMFLLAKLICSNLVNQPSRENLELELADKNLPQELAQAYSRIIDRIFVKASRQEKEASQKLLSWLVCAKRTLKWHEIQAAKSVNLETQNVDLEQYKFRVTPKDLCGSLVEVRQDKTVELVHTTVKSFLISANHVEVQLGEMKMTSLCVNYLNLPGLSRSESHDELGARIWTGYFAFLDYSIFYWVRHLEAYLTSEDQDEELFKDLSECLEIFLEMHFQRPETNQAIQTSKRTVQRLKPFEGLSFYDDLQLVITSARKQLTHSGQMASSEIVLDLGDIAISIRNLLEDSYNNIAQEDARKIEFEEMYGENIYKCPKLSCHAFHNGFARKKERDAHVNKHDRPFRCEEVGCPLEIIGFSTRGDLQKHVDKTHSVQRDTEGVFPSQSEIFPPDEQNGSQVTKSPEKIGTEPPSEEGQLGPEPAHQYGEKDGQRSKYTCPECSKVFHRSYNLKAHMRTHNNLRPYSCNECTRSFTRKGDLVRHESSHRPHEFKCGGVLKTGETWGCGKTFARADTLKAHYGTEVGKRCKQPFLQQQENEEKGQCSSSRGATR